MRSRISRRKFIKLGSLGLMGTALGIHLKNGFDIIIKNGSVLDGSGQAATRLDVGIKGEMITTIGDLSSAEGTMIIDAAGLVVSPGFIDIHTHTDVELIANPLGESKVRQGVTTEISGNCGSSPFPLTPDNRSRLDETWQKRFGTGVTWDDLEGFFRHLEQLKPSINYATFTGQGTLRGAVVGKNDVPPGPDQMKEMKRLLTRSMEMGSLGLSTGLEYTPGSYAKTEELIELARVAASYGGVYATHMRNEDDTVLEAIEEAVRICREAEISTQLSHLKVCNESNWDKISEMLALVERAADTLPVKADRYPYVAWGTGLTTFLPLGARQGETEEVLNRLEDPEQSKTIKTYAESRATRIGGWDRVMISSCASEEGKRYQGRTILSCAEEAGKPPVDFAMDLLLSERSRVSVVGFAMNEENLKKVLAAPFTMIGSDGSAISPYGRLGEGNPHPRFYGTFPRVLGRYCREEKVIDLPTAIHKMTGMPAEKLALKDRGFLKEGKAADITIFDPVSIIDHATFTEPHQYPSGIEYVIVNGQVTVKKGEHTGARAGRIVRSLA